MGMHQTPKRSFEWDEEIDAHVIEEKKPRRLGKWEAPEVEATEDPAPITLEQLQLALSNRLGLEPEDVDGDANFVMDIFGFDDRIIDNVLDREDRQLFYVLEEEGMLSTDREETTLHDGREWRTHYWALRKNVIKQLALDERTKTRGRREHDEADFYNGLPPDVWTSQRL